MPPELAVASIIALGGIITAIIAGVFGLITSRSTKAVTGNTVEIAALSAQALNLVDHYKSLAESAEKRLAAQNKTIATQRETIDRLLLRQDILRRAAESNEQ